MVNNGLLWDEPRGFGCRSLLIGQRRGEVSLPHCTPLLPRYCFSRTLFARDLVAMGTALSKGHTNTRAADASSLAAAREARGNDVIVNRSVMPA